MTSQTSTPRVLPNPGSVALLGTVLLLDVKCLDGFVVRHEWDEGEGPGLLWSPTRRALYFFPGMSFHRWKEIQTPGTPLLREQRLDMREVNTYLKRRGIALPSDTRAAAKLFAQWAARPATRFTTKNVPAYRLHCVGSGVKIDYRSDKWNGRNGRRVNYTHAMPASGSDRVSTTRGGTRTRPPAAFFIKGPRLTVTERGIVY